MQRINTKQVRHATINTKLLTNQLSSYNSTDLLSVEKQRLPRDPNTRQFKDQPDAIPQRHGSAG